MATNLVDRWMHHLQPAVATAAPARARTIAAPLAILEQSRGGMTLRRAVFAVVLTLTLATAFAIGHGLRFAPVKDEVYFLEAAHFFSGGFPPTLDQLRSYPVMQTPLAFVVWGQIEHLGGDPLFTGRLLNLALAAAIVCLVAFRRGDPSPERLLASVGLLAYPYLFGLGIHLYTDVPAAFLALLGVWAYLRGRSVLAFASLTLAIATRQYLVAVPVALVAWECTRSARGEARRWSQGGCVALAAATLLGWFAVFGGLAPKIGEARWLPGYPAPMKEPMNFMIDYGLYFLAAIGAYVVLPEAILFRRRPCWRALATRRSAALAAGLFVLFALFPPASGGLLDRAARLVLAPVAADAGRIALFYGLALLAVVRFTQRLDLAFWIVAVHFALSMKMQLPWDKYYMPAIVVLWFLRAEGMLDESIPVASRARRALQHARARLAMMPAG